MLPLGVRRRQPLVYSKDSPGLQRRLLVPRPGLIDLLRWAVGVADDPVPRDQLRGGVAGVADGDGVGKAVRVLRRGFARRYWAGPDLNWFVGMAPMVALLRQ